MAIWAGFAISKFVEWVGSAVVNKHVNTGYSYLRERILSYNSEAKLKRLKTALPQIKAVMGVAEALKMKDPHNSEWVKQFKQAVEASQLVLNDLEYKNQDEAGGSASSSKKRKRCTINDGTLKRLKDAVTLLDRATTDIDCLLQLATALCVHCVSESRQDTNKILWREIKLSLAEREVLGCRNLSVNLLHLKLSYLENDHLCPSSMVSFRSLRVLTIKTCPGLNALPQINNLKEIWFRQNNSTLSTSTDDFLMNLHNVSISTFDLLKDVHDLPASLNKDIKGHRMQNRQSQKSVKPVLNQSGLEALQAFQDLTCSGCHVGFLTVTSSDVAELKNRERHKVGESSRSNEFITMDVD